MCPASTVCVCVQCSFTAAAADDDDALARELALHHSVERADSIFLCQPEKNLHENWALPASVCVMESWWLCCKSVLQLLFSSFLDSPHILFFFFGLLWYTLACWLPQQQQHLLLVRQTHTHRKTERVKKGFESLKEALVGLYEKLFQAIWHDAPNLGKISVLVCVVRLVHLLAKGKARRWEWDSGCF